MSSRFAKPHGNNSDEGGRNVDRDVAYGLANRIRRWERSCRRLLAKQTRVRDGENGFIDHQCKTDSSIPAVLFCIRGARLRAHCSPRENALRRTLKSEQARALLSLKEKKAGNAICRSRERRLLRSRSFQQQSSGITFAWHRKTMPRVRIIKILSHRIQWLVHTVQRQYGNFTFSP